jgi:predicted porin
MKKSLFAVAAVTAFAGAAQAQSSVTVYGILDAGFSGLSTSTPTTAGNGTNKATSTQFGNSYEQSSRLGFKGQEDLGGGVSAVFTIETGLTNTSSQLSTLNNRQTFVGVAKKGLGQAAIGTQYTPVHIAFAATDAGQNNNTVGNVVRPVSGTAGGQSSASSAYTISTTNTLTAQSDSFAGFKFNAQYTQNGLDQTQYGNNNVTSKAVDGTVQTLNSSWGGSTNFNGWGLGANYTWNKLFATVAYQSFKTEQNNGYLALTSTKVGSPGTTWNELTLPNTTDRQWYAGVTYDFGVLKAYANYINRKVTSGLDSNQFASRTAEQIGVRSFITPTIEAWGSAGLGRYSAFGAGQPTANFNAWQLGSNYWLSKRTNLYAIYGQTLTSNASTVTAANVTAGGGAKASQYSMGVRHTF